MIKNKKVIFGITSFGCLILMTIVFFKSWIFYNQQKFQIPVLMYHQVLPKEDIKNQTDVISTADFEKQLSYLKTNGYKTLTLEEFYCWKKGKCQIPKKSVLLTFDDGFNSIHYFAEPLLKKYEYNAVAFIITSLVPKVTAEYKSGVYATIGDDIINPASGIANTTFQFASHSHDMHKYINKKQAAYSMSYEQINADFEKSSKVLNTKYLSYPYNTDTKNFVKALKANDYKLAFRGESEKCTKNANNYQIPRIGVNSDFSKFCDIFEKKKYNNKYGYKFLRRVLVTIERKLGVSL